MQTQHQRNKVPREAEFFTDYGNASRYKILEIIGKGSYGVVCAAIDTHTGGKVAIKKVTNIFEHMSDAVRILREIKLLRLLRHPDIVDIKRIMLPPSKRDFRDIYVIFELMESDLHQVIKANNDLTHEHQRFFLYQMLRALKYMHTASVYHRDLKPKNILANANCKLKICDLGLARVALSDTPMTVCWTDYVATRWYRAPELCGSFFSKYTPAIDIWSIGCIFAEVLTGKPLFPGKSVVHQLDLITDLLGTASPDIITGIRNEKAKKYLLNMKNKHPVAFSVKFPNADPLALKLLQRMLAFDPKDRPSAEEALADPYFKGLAKIEREPSCQPISKLEFDFETRRLSKEDIRELIYREILEYHPQLLKDYMAGNGGISFVYPSAISHLKKQYAYLEENIDGNRAVIPLARKHVSLPRSTVNTCPIPPNPQPIISAFSNRQFRGEISVGAIYRTVSTASQASLQSANVIEVKSARIAGPVIPNENMEPAKDSHTARVCIPNPALPQSNTPHYFHQTRPRKNQEIYEMEGETKSSQYNQHMKQHVAEKHTNAQGQYAWPHPGISLVDMNANPYAKAGMLDNQIPIDRKLLQAQAQFVAAGAAVVVAAHREAGALQLRLT